MCRIVSLLTKKGMKIKNKTGSIQVARGSLTVEAALVLPFFLFAFFLILFIVKVVNVQVALDHAVRETAREMAASAYPLSLFNEWEDELAEGGELENTDLEQKTDGSDYSNLMLESDEFIEKVIAGELKETDLEEILQILTGAADSDWHYYNLQDVGKYHAAKKIMTRHLSASNLNPEKLILCLVQLPQSNYAFVGNKDDPRYREAGLLPGKDFSKEDVVIQVQYTLNIPLPFLQDKTVLLKNTAIERAWLHGGNGVYTDREEKGLFEDAQQELEYTVYITRTGRKYHLSGCRYLRKSKIPVTLEEARKDYQPCKVCRPPG